ncbi:MAG: NAD-dependent epimerase/dehydratase family protein [Phycisphaerae bacterium]|nr:NAD-dependent epimerase/dehydratase family protein [Phycisphaerae bacterium]
MASGTILVTGGTGFIGNRLVRRLLGDGHTVRAMCLRADPGAPSLAALGAEVVTGDVTDAASVDRAARGVQRIFHCAGVVTDWAPRSLFDRVHVDGIRHLLAAAARQQVDRFVWISTNDVFGLREDRVLREDDDLRPWAEPYPDTKIAAERLAWHAYSRWRVPVTTVYPCWVYGPGDTTFVPQLADAILSGEMIYWRNGTFVWPAHVDNVVDLLVRIGWQDAAVGQGYLVHDGVRLTLQDFCCRIAHHLGVAPPRWRIPYGMAYALAAGMELTWRALRIRSRPLLTTYTVKNLGSRLRFSIDKARHELGWTPPIPFEVGFAETMRWLRTLDRSALRTK